jgi:UDP-N-acetylmuramate dehydrogenase
MNIQENVSLATHSTMRLGGNAKYLTEVVSVDELVEAVTYADINKLKLIVIGDGSNIVWTDAGFDGLVIVNKIMGFELAQADDSTATLKIGAGENWDSVVERTVDAGFFTLAPLSLIPGTNGATPVQNVGAYGQEISNTLVELEAYDTSSKKIVTLTNEQCGFSYRNSIFKSGEKNRYLITSITLELSKSNTLVPYYDAVNSYAEENSLEIVSPNDLRNAVIAIRSSKLPDPKEVANCGSFFANPIITSAKLNTILASYPEIKFWNIDDGSAKISAAWLIDKAGFKDVHDEATGMATWHKQPLVIVNENAKSYKDLLTFKETIVNKVSEMFGITLEQEPELI